MSRNIILDVSKRGDRKPLNTLYTNIILPLDSMDIVTK